MRKNFPYHNISVLYSFLISASINSIDKYLLRKIKKQVDLGTMYDITNIHIYNRTDACSERLSNYTIYLLDEDGNEVWSNHQIDMANLNMRTGRWAVYGCAHKVMNTIDIQEIWST